MTANCAIGYHNVLAEETVTASTEATGFEKENAFDKNTVDYWKPTASPAWLKATGRMPLGMWLADTTAETLSSGTDDDLSVNSNDLTVNGSGLIKSAVADAAQLMGYSNWSASNYLNMAYNALFDPGTNDWSWSAWVRKDANTVNGIIVSRAYYSGGWSGAIIRFYVQTNGYIIGDISDDGFATNDQIASNKYIDDGKWHYVTFQRNGTDLELFIDAAPAAPSVTITNAAGSLSNASATIRIGVNQAGGMEAADLTLAKVRAYDSALTQAEILADMNAEKGFFAANATVDESLISHAATTADYFAMYAHDFAASGSSVVLQYSDNDSTWTDAFLPIFPATSKPIFKTFARSSHKYWRIYTTGSEQQIGVAMFGKKLTMQRGLGAGFAPLNLASENESLNSETDNGNFVGRSTKKRPIRASLKFNNMTPAWVRANWPGLLASLESGPFFVLPSPDSFEDEAAFCWTSGNISAPVYSRDNLLGVSIPLLARIT